MQPVQAFLIFAGCRRRERFVESVRLQIQQQRNGDRLQIANAFRRFDRRAGENASAPGLLPKCFGELRRKLLQPIDVFRLADERESELTDLREIAVVNFQAFDRFEAAREKIEHFACRASSA